MASSRFAKAALAAVQGFNAHLAGRDLESELQAMHDRWRRDGIGAIQKGNPSIVRQRGGDFKVTGKGGVDFVGHYKGKPVAYDAKSREGKASLALMDRAGRNNERAEVSFLLDFDRSGGVAFLLVRDLSLFRCYLVHRREDLARLYAGDTIKLREDLPPRGSGAARVACIEHHTEEAYRRASLSPRGPWDWPRVLLPFLEV